MKKKYSIMYTACIYENKEFIFDDGTISTSWTKPHDLWPNKIRSQVFSDIDSDCPTIIQIGANDGVAGEYYGFLPFLEELNNFKLILIEPQQKYISCLKQIYGKFFNKVEYGNFAITDKTDTFLMTNRQNCAQIVSENTDSYIDFSEKNTIKGICWKDFIQKYNIKKIDVLLMDCEGYEINILKQFEEVGIFPKKIRYEYPHFANQDLVDNLLKKYGYSIEYCLTDPCWDKVAIFEGQKVEYDISQQWKIPKNVL
jgi:FkbM family methyltransferase